MVKGCQKKTIDIKDTGSRYYEEAYFVLRPGASELSAAEGDMINEAVRIADESMDSARAIKRRRLVFHTVISFIAGMAAGAFAAAVVMIVTGL